MRLTQFWERMTTQFGAQYAESLARDLVISELGGRTVVQALASDMAIADVWKGVCEATGVPLTRRH